MKFRSVWSNKLDIVDSYLKSDQLDTAKEFAQAVLEENKDSDTEMLNEDEIEYLKLVSALKELKENWISTLDKHIKRKRKNE